ncbi:MAG: hypothetical protein ABSB42_21695 [Tepidisphaeraceae bacterium]|jgi:hypothetical protein
MENAQTEESAQTAASEPKQESSHPAAAAKPAGGGGYAIAKAEAKCRVCGRAIAVGEKLMAALRETPAALERVDVCAGCWNGFDKTGLLGYWQTTMHPPTAKKNVFVDDDVLCELFERLGQAVDPAKVNFRFVLGLILMRKRRIVYESTRHDGEKEIWSVRFKGREELLDLLNPRLDEQQVGEVSVQLGEILNGDL